MLMKATMNDSRAKVRKSRLVFRFEGCLALALLGADDGGGGFASPWPLEPGVEEMDVGRMELDMELLVWV